MMDRLTDMLIPSSILYLLAGNEIKLLLCGCAGENGVRALTDPLSFVITRCFAGEEIGRSHSIRRDPIPFNKTKRIDNIISRSRTLVLTQRLN